MSENEDILVEGILQLGRLEKDWIDIFKTRHNEQLPFDVTCMWGEALTHQFLDIGDNYNDKHLLSNMYETALSGDFPVLLFTSLIEPEVSWSAWARSKVPYFGKPLGKPARAYLEYSPFVVRLFGDKEPRIETHKLGVTWNYLLGTWGSAYAGDFADNLMLADNMLKGKLGWGLGQVKDFCSCSITNPLSPSIPNFMFHDEGPFKKQHFLRPIDSGIELKIPFPPLFERNTDIIIAINESSDGEYKNGRNIMEQTKEWADNHGQQCPKITISELSLTDEEPDLIIDQKNPQAPIVIYIKGAPAQMQPINDKKLFDKIYNDMYNKVIRSVDLFKTAITYHLEKRQG